MVVGADGRTDGRTDRQTDGRTDTQNFGGYNIIPRHFLVAGHKNGGNLGLVLKIKNTACISILLTNRVKYTYLYVIEFVLYSIVTF